MQRQNLQRQKISCQDRKDTNMLSVSILNLTRSMSSIAIKESRILCSNIIFSFCYSVGDQSWCLLLTDILGFDGNLIDEDLSASCVWWAVFSFHFLWLWESQMLSNHSTNKLNQYSFHKCFSRTAMAINLLLVSFLCLAMAALTACFKVVWGYLKRRARGQGGGLRLFTPSSYNWWPT